MEVKKQLLSLTPYKPGKPIEEVKKEFGLEKVIKLASNENPYGSSPKAVEAIKQEASKLTLYPDGYASELRTAVANFLNVKETELLFGNGSDEVIQVLCRSLLTKDTNTVMATPTFSQYKHNAVIEGAEIREVPLVDGQHDLDKMLESIDGKTRIVWICSPNNPTGTYVNKDRLHAFLQRVPETTLVAIDEAYYEYATALDYPETIPLLSQYKNLIILRTFSKAYGLAALRVGYGVANTELLQKIEPAREPFNTSRLAQAAACASIEDQVFIEECRQKNTKGLQQYYNFCKEHKLSYYPSETNFILIDFKHYEGDAIFNYLLQKGIIIRSGNALGFPTSIRITVGSEEENKEILGHLHTFLQEHAVQS
ncbi:histidinol-phosphate transaminase [Priestia endophytica]|uniref:histidinol-phosphate transaminase n=1 Tax=Priestia endophytica TaxID=135735 RepID=UPI003D28AC32